MLFDSVSYICVEGVIGAGKTSLSQILSQRYNWELMLEDFESNPFLTDFYKDRESVAFQTELWFLLQRYRQILRTLTEIDLFHPVVVSDYMFMKQRMFCMVNLDENEQKLFNDMERTFREYIPSPEFVIYLRTSTEKLMQRINRRDRDFEKNISTDYIEKLNNSYEDFFRHYKTSPLCVINTDSLDFVNRDEDREKIIEVIEGMEGVYVSYAPEDSNQRIFDR